MNVLENIQSCVDLKVPYDLPVFALSQEFDAHYAGHSYGDYIRDAQTVIDTQLLAREKFGWDWVWLHIDETLEFEPLGVTVRAEPKIVPCVAEFLPFNASTVKGLKLPNPKTAARLPILMDAITGLREKLGDETCITGRVTAPFTAVTLLFGMTESFMMMADNPRLLESAMKFGEELAIAIGLAQIEAGAHALWLGDSNASTHLMSTEHFKQWALQPCKRVTAALKEAGAYVFLHNSEESIDGLKLQARTEPSLMSMGPGVDISRVRAALPDLPIMGNIDPIGLMQLGSASQVAAETDRLVRVAANGGMIINSGECIPRDAKGPNLHTMVDTAKKIWNIAHART